MPFRPEILAQAIVAIVTGLLYLYIGRIVAARHLADDARTANTMFATWWFSLAALQGAVAIYQVVAAYGYRDLATVVTLINLILLVIVIALWGLLGYLLYLYTGHRRWFWPLTVVYSAMGIGLLYLIAWMDPTGLKETGLGVELTFGRELGGAGQRALGLIISLPLFVAAVAYGTLFFRTSSPAARYRIAMVAGALMIWFGWSLISGMLDLQARYADSVGFYVANAANGLIGPLVILAAFRPPKWVSHRLDAAGAARGD